MREIEEQDDTVRHIRVFTDQKLHITWMSPTGRTKGEEEITYKEAQHHPPPIQHIPASTSRRD